MLATHIDKPTKLYKRLNLAYRVDEVAQKKIFQKDKQIDSSGENENRCQCDGPTPEDLYLQILKRSSGPYHWVRFGS